MYLLSAGIENETFAKFSMNVDNVDPKEFEIFSQNVGNCVSGTLWLGDRECIEYDYEKSMVSFNLCDIKVSFVNKHAPECLREVLCDMLVD